MAIELPTVAAVAAAFRETLGIVTSIAKLVDNAEAKQKLTDLFARITDLQVKLSAAYSKVDESADIARECSRKLREHEERDNEELRYELIELPTGVFVYARRADAHPSEPPHYLCPNCMKQHNPSILQPAPSNRMKRVCHQCHFEALIDVPKHSSSPLVSTGGFSPANLPFTQG